MEGRGKALDTQGDAKREQKKTPKKERGGYFRKSEICTECQKVVFSSIFYAFSQKKKTFLITEL